MGGMLAVAFHAQNKKSTSCVAFAPAGIKTIVMAGETFGKVFNKLISTDAGFKALVKDQWARSGKFIGKEKFDEIIQNLTDSIQDKPNFIKRMLWQIKHYPWAGGLEYFRAAAKKGNLNVYWCDRDSYIDTKYSVEQAKGLEGNPNIQVVQGMHEHCIFCPKWAREIVQTMGK